MAVTQPLPRADVAPRGPSAEHTGFATVVFGVLFFGDALRNSVNWAGWAVVCLAVVVWAVALLVRNPPRPSRSPALLGLLLLWMIASLIWSDYRAGSLLGIGTQLMTTAGAVAVAVTVSWEGIVKALGRALRAIVVLSLLFELVVALFVRQPFCPIYVDCSGSHPAAFYWTRDALFTGGQIQGLPGNSNLLAIYALLALAVTAVQWHARSIERRQAWVGIAASVLALGLTRSSTVFACLAVAALVFGFAVLARRVRLGRRWMVAVLAALVAGALAAAVSVGWGLILRVLEKSPDLTGRGTIWKSVYELAIQRPVVGWGWTGWWQPYLEPFKGLAVRNGVVYLQAHNAYLDVWFQIGWIGLALFLAVIVTTTARSWWWATDRRMLGPGRPAPWNTLDLLPMLLMSIMLVHGLAESRLNVEWGWALLVVVCFATRRDNYRWWSTPAPDAR
ncbi:O-antigen ligase [Frondihabitans sp. PhB188]|uniref:O-antigen ligase family protein n=1 Tax=Frondihabitans sp. PhB188 TaxID=2485200 RepID=UPI000F4696F6|nr:O-antigen ligase family protein [Frondihabitans sp. PhB188]ROQ36633.1 O-antigen ligase [Frondihabitans sp. PhB188]